MTVTFRATTPATLVGVRRRVAAAATAAGLDAARAHQLVVAVNEVVTDVSGPPPGPDRGHGRGVWLARHLCDRLEVRSDRAGTTVVLRVKIAA